MHYYNARWYDSSLGRFAQADTIISGGVQGYDRYAYVSNSPLRYTDPTGHMMCAVCGGEGGSYTPLPTNNNYCSTHPGACGGGGGSGGGGASGGGGLPSPLPIPNPGDSGSLTQLAISDPTCGSGNYSPHCDGWHFYATGPTLVCPTEFACSKQEMIDYLSRFAYPGQYPSNPVHNTDKNPVGVGPLSLAGLSLGPYSMGPLGEIQTFISNEGLTIKNVTQSGHIFYDGIIIRTVYQGEDGAWYVRTYGYGNNVNPGMDKVNQMFGDNLFNAWINR